MTTAASRLRISRQAMDVVGSNTDFLDDRQVQDAVANKVYYGPVYFRRETEPYMTLAVAGARRDAGVSVAEVNLKHIWDVVNQIQVGRSGRAYVVDAKAGSSRIPTSASCCATPTCPSLRRSGGASASKPRTPSSAQIALDVRGKRVLTAHALRRRSTGWCSSSCPSEANAPLYCGASRAPSSSSLAGLVLALLAALFLARRMVVPIQTLTAGAARIGTGALDHRIAIKTGDELEALGDQFNRMAAQLRILCDAGAQGRGAHASAAGRQPAKSRFLAAASHDLRQPLHALNLFVAQLRSERIRPSAAGSSRGSKPPSPT